MRDSKGEFLAMGVTGIVELLATGEVMKSPRPGEDEVLCRKEMDVEAEIYRRLKEKVGHPSDLFNALHLTKPMQRSH